MTSPRPNCSGLVSVFRVRADRCNRLWVLDSGVMDSIETFNSVCPPKLMVFDMRTDRMVNKQHAVVRQSPFEESQLYVITCTARSRFTAEERNAAAGDLEAQHAAHQSRDRRPDRLVSSARRVPGRLRQRFCVHDRQHQPRHSGVRRETGHGLETFASLHVSRPGLRDSDGASCVTITISPVVVLDKKKPKINVRFYR